MRDMLFFNSFDKKNMQKLAIIIVLFFISIQNNAQKANWILEVPGKNEPCKIDEKGVSVLPSGRWVKPAGEMIRITHDPFGMALSPDGQKAVTLHNGVFTIINIKTLENIRVPGYDKKIKSPLSNGSFLGVAFSGDSKTVYLSGGDNGAVIVYNIATLERIDSISLNGLFSNQLFEDSFTSDLLLNGNELLVLDRGNFRMVRYNLSQKKNTTILN